MDLSLLDLSSRSHIITDSGHVEVRSLTNGDGHCFWVQVVSEAVQEGSSVL